MSSAICCKELQWELAAVMAMSGATFATSSGHWAEVNGDTVSSGAI